MGTIALNPRKTSMSDTNLIQRIQDILSRHDTVPQGIKDELILLGLAEVLQTVQDHSARLLFLEKYKPYLQGLVWAVSIIGVSLLTMAISGRLQVTVTP